VVHAGPARRQSPDLRRVHAGARGLTIGCLVDTSPSYVPADASTESAARKDHRVPSNAGPGCHSQREAGESEPFWASADHSALYRRQDAGGVAGAGIGRQPIPCRFSVCWRRSQLEAGPNRVWDERLAEPDTHGVLARHPVR
jgi:hypothetical protein